jgi:hypothetical protein
MKKNILLSVISLIISINANAQSKINWDWFNYRNLISWNIGCDMGGSYKNVMYEPDYVWGMSISCLGLYYDWGSSSPCGINSVEVGKWNGTSASYKHIGLTIPVSRHFTITPIYGTVTTRYGIVNGDDWYVGTDGVTNRFEVLGKSEYSDYGVVINAILTFPKHIELPFGLSCGIKITKHQTFFNCGMFFDIGLLFKKN